MEKKPQNKLGRGLGKMLGSYDLPVVPTSPANVQSSAISNIRIDSIEINPYQPRVDFDEEAIQQLAQSIKTYGLIQPVTVRPVRDGKYQLISGERRLRACKLVGLTEIPAFVRTVDEINSLQMALVENIQRENLNAIEVAASYQRLLNECNLTVEDLSVKVGKDRSTIANYLRLLRLTREAQIAVRDKKITMGHARAIVAIDDPDTQNKLLKEVEEKALSVRQTEALVKKYLEPTPSPKTQVKIKLSEHVNEFAKKFSKKVNSKVVVKKEITGKGKILIPFNSDEELNKIITILNDLK